MSLNVDLAERVLELITEHPDLHNQEIWHCGSTSCIAGWTVTLAAVEGVEWTKPGDPGHQPTGRLVCNEGQFPLAEGEENFSLEEMREKLLEHPTLPGKEYVSVPHAAATLLAPGDAELQDRLWELFYVVGNADAADALRGLIEEAQR